MKSIFENIKMKGALKTEYHASDKMRDLIRENKQLILIMSRFGITSGFGDKSIEACCSAYGVDLNTFLAVVNFVLRGICTPTRVQLQSLMKYLKYAHEYYLNFNLPAIRRKLVESINHADTKEEVYLVLRIFDEYVKSVRQHMEYENKQVFTYVERLLTHEINEHESIVKLMTGHSASAAKIDELLEITNHYYPRQDNFLFNSLILDLLIYSEDFAGHCRLEDQLFVPAVMRLEKQVMAKRNRTAQTNTSSISTQNNNPDELTDREVNILQYIAQGMSNKNIADRLCLSVHTIIKYRQSITNKLQIRSTAGLTIYSIVNKLITIEEVK